MKLFGWRIDVVLLAFAVGLMVALAGQQCYLWWQVEAPLVEELTALDGVEEVRLETGPGGTQEAWVVLGADVRLIDLYGPIAEQLEDRLGSDAELVLVDRRSPELQEAWDALGFTVQEGAATGELDAMRRRVERWAAAKGLASQLFVDDQHIYVTLKKDGHYLHEVIGRQDVTKAGGLKLTTRGNGA